MLAFFQKKKWCEIAGKGEDGDKIPLIESWTAQHCQKWVYQEAEEIKYLGARGRTEKQSPKINSNVW